MSNKEQLPSNWTRQKLDSLRKLLADSPDKLPDKANQLASHLSPPQDRVESETDENMLSIIVNDALAGVDITTRYPTFYNHILAHARLRRAFLDALDILDSDAAGELEPLPQKASRDLSFLQTAASSHPTIKQTTPTKWRASWQLFVGLMNQRFFPQPQLVYRMTEEAMAGDDIILLRSNFQVGDEELDVLLEASTPIEELGILQLSILAAAPGQLQPSLQANIKWGSYNETVQLDQRGQAQFPPVAINEIYDEARQTIKTDLHLNLAAT